MKKFWEIREAVDSTDTGGKEEVSMATKQIKAMRHFLDGIEERVKSTGDMEEWYQNKLTKANDYLKTLYSYGKGDQNESVEEGYASAAQRKAVWASRNDEKEKNKKEDSDAVKAFLAKGGKIKKLPPAKAQGYHGKDDPGQDVKGIMNKDDSKAIGTRKKVKSMEAKQTHMFDNEKDARAKAKEIGGKYVKGVGKSAGKHAAIKELSHDTMNKYHDAAQKSKDRATNSAVANILRKTSHSKDLKTRAKRIKGMELAKTRSIKKIRGDK